ncbi:MAG: DUF4394 domain-containing protein [Sphingobacteriaceae bacterium]|nr:DUF4394 domain-containing protein [Sphingobacteriaceae bacterium]
MIKKYKTLNILLAGMVLMSGLFQACKDDDTPVLENTVKPGVNFVALTNTTSIHGGGQLVRYNSSNTSQLVGAAVGITGLATGESIVAIDYRPATGQLYGLSTASKLYILNPVNGAARAVSTTAFTPALTGTVAAFDFNPTVDRIRVVTTTGQNFRLNPETGTVVASDATINGADGAFITGAAYSENYSGATTTVLYDLDVAAKKLYKQDANAGTLTEVGSLRLTPIVSTNITSFSGAYNTNITTARTVAAGGFDIASNGVALAVFQNNAQPAIPVGGITASPANPATAVSAVAGISTLFQVNLEIGRATDLGVLFLPVPSGGIAATAIVGIAINTDPVAYATDEANNLLTFNPNKPGTPLSKAITGLQAAETVQGIDFRPSTGVLYALGSTSRIYTINIATGAATAVNVLPFVPTLSGTSFGFDFNPTTAADNIKIVSNTGQNLTVSPAGVATLNTSIAATAEITAAAFSSNAVPTTSTKLYVIDTKIDSLLEQNPSSGVLTRIGKLGINTAVSNGFDIGGVSSTAYAVFTVGAVTKVYTISLTNGSVTEKGILPSKVNGFTVGLGF